MLFVLCDVVFWEDSSTLLLKEDMNQSFGQVFFVCHDQCLQQKDMTLCMFSTISGCMIGWLY